MTRRRWIADEVSGNRAALTGDHARHLSQVLRAQIGQEFDVAVQGELRRGRVSHVSPGRVEFELGEIILYPESANITVAISIFKFDRMEWAIEKCTELGVARIIPVIAARSEPHLASAAEKRVERWRRIAQSASEQSRRVSPPKISLPMKVTELLAGVGTSRIVLSEIEEGRTLKDAVTENLAPLTLAIGPEGGWKEEELEEFRAAGWTTASLGPTILRAETAVIAGVAIAAAMIIPKS